MRWIALLLILLLGTSVAGTIRFGYDVAQFARMNKDDVEMTLRIWLEEIAGDDRLDIKIRPYDDAQSLAEDFKAGKLDLVSTSALDYVRSFDLALLEDGLTPGASLSDALRLIVVTRKDAAIKTWDELSEARIMTLAGSDIAKVYMETEMMRRGLPTDQTWIESNSYRQSLLRLFFGKADAAIVAQRAYDLAIEMNPQFSKKTQVFAISPLRDIVASFFRKGLDARQRQRILEVGERLQDNPRGRQLLVIFQSKSLKRISVDDLAPIEKAYDTYLRLRSNSSDPKPKNAKDS